MKSLRKSLLLLILLIIIFICIPLKDIINEPSIIQQEISAPLDFFCFHKEASLFQLIVSKEVCTVENVIADSASCKVAWFSHLYYFRSWDFDNNSIFFVLRYDWWLDFYQQIQIWHHQKLLCLSIDCQKRLFYRLLVMQFLLFIFSVASNATKQNFWHLIIQTGLCVIR